MIPIDWDRLNTVEQLEGDEARQAVGQGIQKLMEDGSGHVRDNPAQLRRRALCLAWVACPHAFGGRSLKSVLEVTP